MVNARMQTLKKQIQKITNLMISLKAKSPVLDEAVKLITDTKGVGNNSALSLLVAMPELEKGKAKKLTHRRHAKASLLAQLHDEKTHTGN